MERRGVETGHGQLRSSSSSINSVQPRITAWAPWAACCVISASSCWREAGFTTPRQSSSKITRCSSARPASSGTLMCRPPGPAETRCSRPRTMLSSSIVKRVPSSSACCTPAACSAAPVASAICSSGKPPPASMSAATLCMVLVASTSAWAPAARRPAAAWPNTWPALAQSPAACSRAMAAKSTLCSNSGALCRPPRRCATPRLMRR